MDQKSRLAGVVWKHQQQSDHEIAGTIAWESDSPLVLTLVFHEVTGDMEWIVARDVFADALRDGSAGLGDIKAKCALGPLAGKPRESPAFILTLTSPYGEAVIATDLTPVIQFCSEIYGIVPRGQEELDVDAFIKELNLLKE